MSFFHAFEGILGALKKEPHLRFHIMIAVLISIFAKFYGISCTEWAVLILTAVSVISAEIFNTALEKAVDTATSEVKPSAKLAKDAAAGAVLALAIAAVFVGICLFGDGKRIMAALRLIFTTPKALLPCLFVGIGMLIFVIYGGKNDK